APNNLFLLPFDANYDDVATTGFPMWDIETALKRFIKAKKVVVIADACHSGGVGQAYDIARRATRGIEINPISSSLQNLSKIGDGVAVISASDDKQFSQESHLWGGGHGVFTYFLLKGLNGEADYNKDGSVTLGELIPYLSE
ncbi:MAG: caspase family protein, partial [Lentisphaerae bacterium]|nr:caspase family protein [Lentisphaerota bacterium]